jgi:hypothetical protein
MLYSEDPSYGYPNITHAISGLCLVFNASMSELRFAKFEPFKSVLLYLRTLNRLNTFRTSTVYAIFAFIRE